MNPTLTPESIPHRPPFLFVDEIVELSDSRITTKQYVDPNSAFFAGHYPGNPVMPGVLLCECCFQAGALLIAHVTGPYVESRGVPVVTRIRDARFKRMVRPGQVLSVEVTLDDELDGAYFLTGRLSVQGALALRVEFACMLTDAKDDDA